MVYLSSDDLEGYCLFPKDQLTFVPDFEDLLNYCTLFINSVRVQVDF